MDVTQGAWPAVGLIAGAIGTLGGLGGVVALINSRSARTKVYAEAEQIRAAAESSEADAAGKITDAALKLMEPLQTEVSRQSRLTGELHTRVGQLESDARTQHMLLVEHSVWDHLALARIKDAGVDLPPIPPLFPPSAPAGASSVTTHAAGSTQVNVQVTQGEEPATQGIPAPHPAS